MPALHRRLLRALSQADDWLQFALGFLLLLIALILLGQTVLVLPQVLSTTHYQQGMLVVVHDIMLVMIVLELLWTVLTYLREHSVPLEPFLFVGIISSVRKLLLIGAQMSLAEVSLAHLPVDEFRLKEIAYHGALVFVLIVGLVLVRWTKRWGDCEGRRKPPAATESPAE